MGRVPNVAVEGVARALVDHDRMSILHACAVIWRAHWGIRADVWRHVTFKTAGFDSRDLSIEVAVTVMDEALAANICTLVLKARARTQNLVQDNSFL